VAEDVHARLGVRPVAGQRREDDSRGAQDDRDRSGPDDSDAESRGGLVARAGYAVAGLSYAGLALGAAQFALGSATAGKGSDASTQDGTAQLLQAPFGPPLVIAIGAIQ